MDITKLKPIIKRIVNARTKQVLTQAHSNGQDLAVTDLETYLVLKSVNLPVGLLDVNSLGLTNQVASEDVSEWPLFPEVKGKNNTINISLDNLELLFASTSTDETRIYLNGIAWINTDLVSIDGHILTLIEGQTKNKQDNTIMPRKSISELIQLCKKFKIKAVNIQVDANYFKVDVEQFTLIGRLILRAFPKYRSVVPSKTKAAVTINKVVKVSEVKDILNRNKAVRLSSIDNVTSLSVDKTEYTTIIGAGEDCNIGFNLKYLNFLLELDSVIKFNNELSPCMVNKDNITRIAMPLKL